MLSRWWRRRRRERAQWLEWSSTTNNNWTPMARKKEKTKEKREKENPSLLPWCASMRMFEFLSSLSLFSPLSLSLICWGPSLFLSLDYPIDCKYILWRISKCVVRSSRKKDVLYRERVSERERQREKMGRDNVWYNTEKSARRERVTRQQAARSQRCYLLTTTIHPPVKPWLGQFRMSGITK